MNEVRRIRLGGYAPRDSTHGQALDRIAEGLRRGLGGRVEIGLDYNIMDRGRPASALLDEVESGELTLCYFSTSYLADRVPALAVVDLPYIFRDLDHAHGCLDGKLGAVLSERTGAGTGLVALGYWDNGFRHLSNRSREVSSPADCQGLRVRLQPNWAHEELFRALGSEPVSNDLAAGIAMLRDGELDAQENPFANFVAYGIHELHPYVTLTGHVYGARGVYASARQLAEWPDADRDVLQASVRAAVVEQRATAARVEVELREWLAARGTKIRELTEAEDAAFRAAAQPVREAAARRFGADLLDLTVG
ncbi:MAG TPA: TRAP transporter substrate-binding protein [Nocardioidaceae bacterium]|nr:TRAP transporter substrate-binding protein [Nocardioidaceae bacterium]